MRVIVFRPNGTTCSSSAAASPGVGLGEPIDDTPPEDDPFYRLPDLAVDAGDNLTNQEMDEAIYGT